MTFLIAPEGFVSPKNLVLVQPLWEREKLKRLLLLGRMVLEGSGATAGARVAVKLRRDSFRAEPNNGARSVTW